jgi:hypothetical protein
MATGWYRKWDFVDRCLSSSLKTADNQYLAGIVAEVYVPATECRSDTKQDLLRSAEAAPGTAGQMKRQKTGSSTLQNDLNRLLHQPTSTPHAHRRSGQAQHPAHGALPPPSERH